MDAGRPVFILDFGGSGYFICPFYSERSVERGFIRHSGVAPVASPYGASGRSFGGGMLD